MSVVMRICAPALGGRKQRVPLRVGDVWVLVGPRTEVRIAALSPRPTSQKPHSQAVTLSDGRTIAEATLRYAYMRRQEYLAWLPEVAAKWRAATNEFFGVSAEVIQFRPAVHPSEGRT